MFIFAHFGGTGTYIIIVHFTDCLLNTDWGGRSTLGYLCTETAEACLNILISLYFNMYFTNY